MSDHKIPPTPKGAFRVCLELSAPQPRIDTVLLEALRNQSRSIDLKALSRASLKELFKKKRIRIKGQAAVPSSSLAKGTTYVDILGYGDTDEPQGSEDTQ